MKIKYLILTTLIPVLMYTSCSEHRQTADLIIANAKIYTVDKEFSLAQSIAVRDGKILEVGTDREIMNRYYTDNLYDAKQKTIYPGFIDAHSHFIGYATGLQRADLRNTGSFDEIIGIVQKHAESHKTEWIVGRGWDQNNWPVKEFPTHQKISELFPETPVVLIRIDGHAVVVNLEAMRRLGISNQSIFPEGEAIYHEGMLSGVFLENSADRFKTAIPQLSRQELIAALSEAEQNCVRAGLTSVTDAGLNRENIDLLDSLHQSGKLLLRVYAMLIPNKENIEHFINKGVYKTERLSVRSIKLYADGALGSRGARLFEPYSDAPGQLGVWVDDIPTMQEYSKLAIENGFQMIVHAIGDAAVSRVLDVYSEFLAQPNDLRWRIEHAQVVHPKDFIRFREYSIVPSIQSTHATSDMRWAGSRLGVERLKYSYAQQWLLEQNGWLPNGTDFPIEEIYPLWTFYAAVARKDHSGYPENGFQMENALSRPDALRSMTLWAARAAFEENEKGSLEPGKVADFVMLNHDILSVPTEQILHTKVLKVWIDGKMVADSEH